MMFDPDKMHYVLDEHGEPQPADARTWGEWFTTHFEQRIIKKTQLTPEVEISTVFVGINTYGCDPPKDLYETMVLGGPMHGAQWRHDDAAEALAGHETAVIIVRAGILARTPSSPRTQ